MQVIAHGHNLHLLDEAANGFAIYRSGVPKLGQFESLCDLGIREVLVTSGNADLYEARYAKKHCPEMQVVYNERQHEDVPFTAEFLERFDGWVAKARARGIKVLFRCDCGCHRTGRLAAYYRLKHNDFTVEEAIAEMDELGYKMGRARHDTLRYQVRALKEYIDGRECTQGAEHCVRSAGEAPG